jgi:hypothetical protein
MATVAGAIFDASLFALSRYVTPCPLQWAIAAVKLEKGALAERA